MNLFTYENYKLHIAPEAYMLTPFKVIIERDKTKNKSKAMNELAYIYFFCDTRSDYQYITDERERSSTIIQDLGLPTKWKPDEEVEYAMEYYNSFKTAAAGLLEDTRFAIGKLRKMLRDIDLNETDVNGKPIYTLNTITATIKQIPQLVRDLDAAEKTLAQEEADNSKLRGDNEKNVFEDGINFEQ